MPTITVQESAAASAVGTDLMANSRVKTANVPRVVASIGVTGSAVLGDSSLDLFYGTRYIGTFFPTTIGVVLPKADSDIMALPSREVCMPGEPIALLVSDAGATNVMRATLNIVDLA